MWLLCVTLLVQKQIIKIGRLTEPIQSHSVRCLPNQYQLPSTSSFPALQLPDSFPAHEVASISSASGSASASAPVTATASRTRVSNNYGSDPNPFEVLGLHADPIPHVAERLKIRKSVIWTRFSDLYRGQVTYLNYAVS